MSRRLLALPAFALTMLLLSCGQGPVLGVDDAVVRLNPNPQAPSALYFTVHGGPKNTELLSVLTRSALRVEMHESLRNAQTGVSSMQPIPQVTIPADTDVQFRQGGKHVMIYGINIPARRLGEIDMVFVFGTGDRLVATVPLETINGGDPMQGIDLSGIDKADKPAPAKAKN